MLEDYNAPNQENKIPLKPTTERTQDEIDRSVSNEVRTQFGLLQKRKNETSYINYIKANTSRKYQRENQYKN